jgi:hypothetical protein
MRRKILLVIPLLVFPLLASVAQEEGSPLDAALVLFAGGDVMIPYSEEGRAQLEAAIEVFRTALGVSEELDEANEEAVGNFDVDFAQKDLVNKLSQAYYTLADAFLAGETNERETYLRGKHWGMKSLRMGSEFAQLEAEEGFVAAVQAETDVVALYWAAANWLRASEFNKLEAIFAGVPEKTEAVSLRCLELDETFNVYGSYRALGAFWGGMPRLPAGTYRKNFNKSLSYFCKVVDEPDLCAECKDCPDFGSFDPVANEYFENRLFFVEFYLIEKEYWQDAARILQDVLSEPIGEAHPLYNALSQEKATEFLEEVEKHL